MNKKSGTGLMDRRQFLTGFGACLGAGAVTGPAAWAETTAPTERNTAGIPMRTLGRTGAKITILGLGSAPVGHSKPGIEAGTKVYRAALEAGIGYVDTAHFYDDAETYLGQVIPAYRDRIFLATKALPTSPDPKESARQMQLQFETSLRLLRTDHVDLLHIHNVGSCSPEMILAPGGPLEFVRNAREKGLTRFVGITGHSLPLHCIGILNTGEIDVLMVVLNFVDNHIYSFTDKVLPVARKHGCGILAMKVFGGHAKGFAGYRQRGPAKMPVELLEKTMRFSLGIEGVAGAIIGPYTVDEAEQNVRWAKRYQPLSAAERQELDERGKAMASEWGPRFGPAA
ncbi:MAG: aldo/keto reductase [Candidatus Omnitrophica bacterium]|nr:aldo/keto reductase [Candidatus Omnitrophota bacterium]